jgi:hypothetical protein
MGKSSTSLHVVNRGDKVSSKLEKGGWQCVWIIYELGCNGIVDGVQSMLLLPFIGLEHLHANLETPLPCLAPY